MTPSTWLPQSSRTEQTLVPASTIALHDLPTTGRCRRFLGLISTILCLAFTSIEWPAARREFDIGKHRSVAHRLKVRCALSGFRRLLEYIDR